jgi:antitoxin component of MazEF toxin-antitoxin module
VKRIVKIQQSKPDGSLSVTIPEHVAKGMGLKKGDEVAFVVDSAEVARFKAIR